MVRTVDLFREYPTTLTTLFSTCFLPNAFEKEFLDTQTRDVSNSKAVTSSGATITEWLYDANQTVPNTSDKHRGIYIRMKFYQIKQCNAHDDVQLTPVTETQTYWVFDRFKNAFCQHLTDDANHTLHSECTVLPQPSISKEPIFNITALMKIYSIRTDCVRVEIRLRVQCRLKAWGISKYAEKLLMDEAHTRYCRWLEFIDTRLQSQPQPNSEAETEAERAKETAYEQEQPSDRDEQDFVTVELPLPTAAMMDGTVIDVSDVATCSSNKSIQIGGTIHSRSGGENVVQKRSTHYSASIDNDRDEEFSDEHEEEVDASRGLHNKRTVTATAKIFRCCNRLYPSLCLVEKKSNIDMLVDSRCKSLEKLLWRVIVVCCALIVTLTFHRYRAH